MANWSTLKAAIAQIIKTNNNQEITGANMQSVLNNIIDNVGENATFVGVATPTTNPGTPDGNVFYIAKNQGVYPNFSNIEVYFSEIGILYWNTSSWEKNSISLSKLIEEVNISNIYPTDGTNGSNKYTLETAIAKVGEELRHAGLKVTFINEEGRLETWEYQGGTFTNASSWNMVGSLRLHELSQTIDSNYLDSALRGLYNYNEDPFILSANGGWAIAAKSPSVINNSIFNYTGNMFKTRAVNSYGIISLYKKALPEDAPQNGYITFEVCCESDTTLYFQLKENEADRTSIDVKAGVISCVQVPYYNRHAVIIPFSPTAGTPSYYIGRIFCGENPVNLSGFKALYNEAVKPQVDKELKEVTDKLVSNFSQLEIKIVKNKLGL